MTTLDSKLVEECTSNENGDEVIPEGWVKTTLQELLDVLESGSRPKGGVRGISEGIPSIGGEHLNSNGSFNLDSIKYVPQSFFDRMNQGHIQFNDILVVKDGATTAKVSLVREDFPFKPAVVNEHVFICRPAKELYSPFLFYFLFSDEGQNRILENFRGSAQGGINHSFAAGTTVPLAPTTEQERIVAKIEELLPLVNTSKERLNRVSLIMKRFRQAVLSAACSGRLTEGWRKEHSCLETAYELIRRIKASAREVAGVPELSEIPEEWSWVYAPELGRMSRGKSRHRPRNAPHLFSGPYPFIQTGDIAQSDGRVTKYSQTYSEAGLAQSRLWPEGTVCITIAANIANSAILTFPACFPDSVVGIIADERLCLKEYVEFFIRTVRSDLDQFAPATAQKNINIQILNDVAIALPPIEEQREIVRRVEALFKLADTIEKRIEAAGIRADKLTKSILAKAFRGELVPTEAELARQEGRSYETASVLLERIKTEREKKPRNPRQVSRR